MKSLSKEYLVLFNAITELEESLAQLRERLIDVQREAEDLYLEEGESLS